MRLITLSPNFTLSVRVSVRPDDSSMLTTAATFENAANGGSQMEPYTITVKVLLAITLGLISLVTIIGNTFVILACCLDRNLKRPSYYLIVSLAVADLLVGLIVMPFSAYYEVQHYRWEIGGALCDVWCTADVMCCSASILHLVAIALDRYWSITDIVYVQNKSIFRIRIMIMVAWIVAGIISIPPVLGWKDAKHQERIDNLDCTLSQELSYQIFAVCFAFFIPLLFISILYVKIYLAARHRIRSRPVSGTAMLNALKRVAHTTLAAAPSLDNEVVTIKMKANEALDDETTRELSEQSEISTVQPTETMLPKSESQSKLSVLTKKFKKKTQEAKRERKAAKTLVIVTG